MYLVCKVTKDNVCVILDDSPKKIRRDSPDAERLIDLVKLYNGVKDSKVREETLEAIIEICNPAKKIEIKSDNRFEFDGESQMYLKGTSDPIPEFLAKKLLDYIDNKLDVDPLIKFWKHLLLNPDSGVRTQLYSFLQHNGHPITEQGYFLAYKACAVKKRYNTETGEEEMQFKYSEDTGELEEKYTQSLVFTSYHQGPHGSIIKVGAPVKMPREECDSNPDRTCSEGLHVGSMEYVHDFGYSEGVILEVLVSPRNVVAVPNDYNNTKMRCCEYFPIAISNGENKDIFLESDYTAFDQEQMEIDMDAYNKAKSEQIEKLEKELAEKLEVSKNLYF